MLFYTTSKPYSHLVTNKHVIAYKNLELDSCDITFPDIKEVIKDDLDCFMKLPYILKADVVKVVINKIDSDPKTYRYRGAIDRKEIVYDKAWNANKNLFQYKAYNMDPNNETPLECVPNALFKMYGDKSKGSTYYNGKIANG
jgi:hypothetical protein